MMRPQPLICVRDVEVSSSWYQRLLGCQSAHGGPHYERLVHSGKLILQLHHWEQEDHHGRIGDPNDMFGNGLLLWFEVGIDDAIARRGRGDGPGRVSFCLATAIRLTEMEVRIIGRSGFATRMDLSRPCKSPDGTSGDGTWQP